MSESGMQYSLLSGAEATGSGSAANIGGNGRTFQATVVGTGAVSSTVVIEVSLDESNWLALGTITLSGTNSATDGFASSATWTYTRARVSAISGTSASVSVLMGV